MVDVLGAFVARTHHDLLVVVQVVFGDGFNLPAHRGREEQGVAVLGHVLEDGVDALGEAHVEHLVGFVEHHVLEVAEVYASSFHEVDEASGRCHDDLCAVTQLVHLCDDAGTAIDGNDVERGNVFGKRREVVGNLQAEFAGRTEDERLCVVRRGIGLLQHRNAIGGGLTRTGLGKRNDVIAITQQIRDYFFLNGHGMFEAQFFNGAANHFADTKFFKCLQVVMN